jgi:glycerol-3-phosphate dehydrogenase subunit B
MTRRAVVVGGGLAGLVAGVRLAREGVAVSVVSRGAGGLALSQGTVDVLGYAPERVASPRDGLAAFAAGHPEHPYARIPAGVVEEAVAWFREVVPGVRLVGDLARNMLLPSPVGAARPTALAPAAMAAAELREGLRLAVVGLAQLKDTFPRLVAENLERADLPAGASVRARALRLETEAWRDRPDAGGLSYARALDHAEYRAGLAADLRPLIEPGETVGMPAVVGIRRHAEAWDHLQELLGAPMAEIPTLPPSIPGMRLQEELIGALRAAGGRLVLGPEVVGVEGERGRIRAVLVRDSARTRAVPADAAVLATGGFASGGLELDSFGVLRETVAGLPVSGPVGDGPALSPRHLDHQPLYTAGVPVDEAARPLDERGMPVWENLHAAGAIVAGAEPWREKSGEGIAIAGGYLAASAILAAG